MNKIILCCLAFLAHSTFATPLSAVMTFESMAITSEGVKKQTQFQERFIRDTNVVWTERIIPKATLHSDHTEDAHEHEHNLNFATAGKWLVRDESQHIKFRFVRTDDKTIIEPRDSEYGTLGFDGVWETAYYLVNRSALEKMTVLPKTAPTGALWYEKRDGQQFTRILWDARREIPLSIESGKLDGTSNNKITLAIVPTAQKKPWDSLAQYQTKAYEDLLD